MPNIYEKDNQYYIKSNNYELCDIMIKRNTIVLMPNGIVVNELDNPKIYTFKELKNKILKGE